MQVIYIAPILYDLVYFLTIIKKNFHEISLVPFVDSAVQKGLAYSMGWVPFLKLFILEYVRNMNVSNAEKVKSRMWSCTVLCVTLWAAVILGLRPWTQLGELLENFVCIPVFNDALLCFVCQSQGI